MTPLRKFEEDSEAICDELNKDNFEAAKMLYNTRIQSLDEDEKKILDLFINNKIHCSLDKFEKVMKSGFDGLFREIRAINQKLWGKDTAINGAG